jgi:BirA family transcriptional regulator, biotin operon repressor / biotin---[acetyl-CoA-carboxylase] ligase
MSEHLDADRLRELLRGVALAREVRVLAETTSTNDVAADFGRQGSESGLVVFAERQTHGRGRMGRAWEAQASRGLLFSILFRPPLGVQEWTRLSTWAGVGIAEGLGHVAGCRALIKWPNDIFINDRKAAGILVESSIGRGRGFAVIGIGINVNQRAFAPPLDETAISLRQVCGHELDRHEVAAAVLRALDDFSKHLENDFGRIVENARGRSYLDRRFVEFVRGNETASGMAEGLDDAGALLVRQADGRLIKVDSGEVTLRFAR